LVALREMAIALGAAGALEQEIGERRARFGAAWIEHQRLLELLHRGAGGALGGLRELEPARPRLLAGRALAGIEEAEGLRAGLFHLGGARVRILRGEAGGGELRRDLLLDVHPRVEPRANHGERDAESESHHRPAPEKLF